MSIFSAAFFNTLLGEHTGNLPAATTTTPVDQGESAMTEQPFYRPSTYHWNIRGASNRWECDDFAGGPQNTTLHQIWVR